MSSHPKPNANDILAALKLLGAGPGGAQNEPVRRAVEALRQAARKGRPEPEAPLPGTGRPGLSAIQRLQQENRLLIDHAEMLACALGACPNCWGNIPDCEDCGGIGKPGAFNPDRACFDRFVLPVITRVMGDRAEDIAVPGSPSGQPDPNHPHNTSV